GARLKAVARTSTEYPDVLRRGMTIDNESAIGGLLVLADAALGQWRILHAGKAECQIFASSPQGFFADLAVARGRIDLRSARIVGELEPSRLIPGNTVHESSAMVGPHGNIALVESRIAGGRSEEKNFLPGGLDTVSDRLWKQLAHPRTASEHVVVGANRGSVGKP